MSTEKVSTFTDRGTILGSELDGLTNGSQSALGSAAIANQTNRDRFGVAQLVVTFAVAPTDQSTCDLYMVAAVNGADYEYSTQVTARQWCGSFAIDNSTAAQRVRTDAFEIPPCPVKFILVDRTGQNFPANGSAVTLFTFNRTVE